MASNQDKTERIFNAMLKAAAEEATIQEMDELPSREELEKMHPRSEALDKRVAKIIGKHERMETRKKAARIFTRVAAAVGIFFTVGFAALMSVEASRVFILNTIISMQYNYVRFDFTDSEKDLQSPDLANLLEGFLPVGFEYEGSFHLETTTIYRYSNEAGVRLIFQQHMGATWSVMVVELNREFFIIDEESHKIYVFDSNVDGYENVIMWADDNYVFNIISDVDIDTLVNIARNMIAR